MVKLRQYEKSESAVVETERKKRHAAMEEATELRNAIESRDLTIQDKVLIKVTSLLYNSPDI